MPRANRHYLPGYVWHITHRCHQKEFLWNWGRTKLSSCNYGDSSFLDISMENGRDRAVVITEKGLSNGSYAES
jgi:hypothetical protein